MYFPPYYSCFEEIASQREHTNAFPSSAIVINCLEEFPEDRGILVECLFQQNIYFGVLFQRGPQRFKAKEDDSSPLPLNAPTVPFQSPTRCLPSVEAPCDSSEQLSPITSSAIEQPSETL